MNRRPGFSKFKLDLGRGYLGFKLVLAGFFRLQTLLPSFFRIQAASRDDFFDNIIIAPQHKRAGF